MDVLVRLQSETSGDASNVTAEMHEDNSQLEPEYSAQAYQFIVDLLRASAEASVEKTQRGALPLSGSDLDNVLGLAAMGLHSGDEQVEKSIVDALHAAFRAAPSRSREKRALFGVIAGRENAKVGGSLCTPQVTCPYSRILPSPPRSYPEYTASGCLRADRVVGPNPASPVVGSGKLGAQDSHAHCRSFGYNRPTFAAHRRWKQPTS